MTLTSATLIRLSIASIVGSGSFPGRRSAVGFTIVTRVVSGSQGWTPADADELCRRCPAYHPPGGGVWGGYRGGCWRSCLRGARLRADAGRGCIRTNRHGMSVMSPSAHRSDNP